MTRIHVLLKKEELDNLRLGDKVVLVLDVLFATTTIIAALADGAKAVIPVADEHAAHRAAKQLDAPGEIVLAGELYAETIAGFASPTPLALQRHGVREKTVIYSTTNGTVALTKSQAAEAVYATALINGQAVVDHVLREHHGNTIVVVCSGSVDTFNLEDFFGAGYIVHLLRQRLGAASDLTDAALAAEAMFDRTRSLELLLASRVGRMMIERALEPEVAFAAQMSTTNLVPRLRDGSLRPA